MEQHPIPRNISGFQFHLIGDMTLRQFGYLAGGFIIAYFLYKAAPFPSIINLSLAGIFALAGFSFAFLPIQERPLDKWLVAFIRSITSPTQYLWVKNNHPPDFLIRTTYLHQQITQPQHQENHREANEKLRLYLSSLPKAPHETLNVREKKYIENTLSLFQSSYSYTNIPKTTLSSVPPLAPNPPVIKTEIPNPNPPKQPSVSPPPPIIPVVNQNPQQSDAVVLNMNKTVPQTHPAPVPASVPIPQPVLQQATPAQHPASADLTALQEQFAQLAAEKKFLEEELLKLKNSSLGNKNISTDNSIISDSPKEPTIRTINPKNVTSEMGLSTLSQVPNIVSGITKDPQKKILPNIILTIKDKKGVPLRALKTNKLGQFAAATPLPNGTYILETEDPMKRYVFDVAEITLSGKIFLPLEITAKGEKELMREKLTKELFGSGNANI